MKKNRLTTCMIILVSMLALYSCKKDKIDSIRIKSNYEKLLDGKWSLNSVIVTPPLNGDTDIYKTYPNCIKDDTIFYKSDSLFLLKTGNIKCKSNEGDSVFYKWYLKDDTIIGLNGAESSIIFLDNSKLIYTTKQVINSKEYLYKSTYMNLK